jgi:ABC-type transport system involved in multi-copper enzyme maturation permease subunit
MSLNMKVIRTVAKKEFMDNLRNKWIITMTILLFMLTLAASVLAGGGQLGGMEDTVASLIGISALLIPIIGIMLGYSTISGEAENGSLSVLLSYPVRRVEVLLGKFLGLGMVIVTATVIGFGVAGILIAATVDSSKMLNYGGFILLTIVLGLIYLSLSMCLSAYCSRRVTSLAGGIVIFFWAMIFGTILFAIYLGAGGSMDAMMRGENIPDWFYGAVFFSPADMNQTAVMMVFGLEEMMGYTFTMPGFVNPGTMMAGHLAWLLIPFLLAYRFFENRDI